MSNNEKLLKEKEYLSYINEHIANVRLAFEKYGKQLCELLNIKYYNLLTNVRHHDESKYTDAEFEGYRQYFYPCSDEEKNKELFDMAWVHHQNYNAHHPEYWIDRSTNEIKDMPPLYIAEMLLDWEAMSMKFNGNTYDYYIKNRDKKPLSENTKLILDKITKELFENK